MLTGTAETTIENEKLQAWCAHRQGLLQEQKIDSPAVLFEQFGWARSLGGGNPYISAFSRARMDRSRLDAAVANLEISELPSARSCTYVLPQSDFAFGLTMGAAVSGASEHKTAKSLGSTDEELERLAEGVLQVLNEGPKDPAAMRGELGSLVRNYGEAGKKKGLTTSLPIALATLQSQGKIVRRPATGRLDEQRYSYALWTSNPPKIDGLTREVALTKAAQCFFRFQKGSVIPPDIPKGLSIIAANCFLSLIATSSDY